MSDATLLPESAIHGGGMVTARLAVDYSRELFAIPGNITAPMSEGPNALIRDNKATLVRCAGDIIKDLGWQAEERIQQAHNKGIERELFTEFIEFTDDEKKVIETLQKGDQTTDTLCLETGLPISTLSAVIFTLEMKGIIRALSGNQYHLINS
jgi:DNA processing protein